VPDEEVDEAKTFDPNVDEDEPEIVFERGRIFKPKNVNMAGTNKNPGIMYSFSVLRLY